MNYNKDIMDWNEFPAYDMIWCDPPWEQRMVKYFETVMRRDSGREASNTITNIINKLGSLASTEKLIVVEYGIKGHELVIRLMEEKGHRFISKHERTYDKRPFLVLVFNREIEMYDTKNESELITKTLLGLKDIKTVFDPFAGIGFTAKAVRKAGIKYIGSEINPARFEKLKKVNI
mgnify:FL=1|jgi:methylase of polypeptide subunit release factors|tara:strand:+ start:727 stop:1254 length:528 start_codon:yes stop_codon:yes gene_type:complete